MMLGSAFLELYITPRPKKRVTARVLFIMLYLSIYFLGNDYFVSFIISL